MTTTESVAKLDETLSLLEQSLRELPEGPAEAVQFSGIETVPLRPRRLRRAKKAYTARFFARETRANECEGYSIVRGDGVVPAAGDLVLARVRVIGQHKRVESYNSRRRHLFAGDEIVVAYGNRYAPDQFLAEVPENLGYTNLVAAGGMAGRVLHKHFDIDLATVIEPIGLIADDEGVINLRRVAPAKIRPWAEAKAEIDAVTKRPRIVMVFGSSMNSGKSTTLGCLVNGLGNAGFIVNAGKATGTGAGNDSNLYNDAGADQVVDFTDFGLVSTFKLTFDEVKDLVFSTVAELAGRDEPDAVIVEIADGIYQGETAALLHDPDFRELVDRVVFACGEALSAAAGSLVLAEAELPLVAISGKLTAAPLVISEAAAVVDVPIIQTYDLCLPEVAREVAGV